MISTIYLDMDDVLCDFSRTYHCVIGIDPKIITPDQWEANWKKWVDGRYFASQPMAPGAESLLQAVSSLGIKTEILTSSGGHEFYDDIASQKIEWLKAHGIPYHVNVVPGFKFKSQFATPHRLLIDDQLRIILDFKAAGGHAIHHQESMAETINELNMLVEEVGYKRYEE